jgi:hypothetical protein
MNQIATSQQIDCNSKTETFLYNILKLFSVTTHQGQKVHLHKRFQLFLGPTSVSSGLFYKTLFTIVNLSLIQFTSDPNACIRVTNNGFVIQQWEEIKMIKNI